MQLPREAVEEFRHIYYKEFGEVLDDDEASQRASDVLDFFKIVARPVPKSRSKMAIESIKSLSLK